MSAPLRRRTGGARSASVGKRPRAPRQPKIPVGVARARSPIERVERRSPPIGARLWAIAEGYIPSGSHGPAPQMTSHETACLLNASGRPAHVAITVYFKDRDPVGPYRVTVAPRRTLHLRFNDLDDPEPIPRDTDYSSVLESDVPIVVQHTRLDSRQAETALLSTIAFSQ